MYIPDGIFLAIFQFYDKYTGFSVFNSKGKEYFTNDVSKYFTINNQSLFIINSEYVLKFVKSGRWGTIFNDYNIFSNQTINIVSQGNSNFHGFIYTLEYKLYGFGGNESNQVGIRYNSNIKYDESIPELIKYRFDSAIKGIQCGGAHSLFLTNKGNVYGCGSNKFNQLTHKYRVNSSYIIQRIISTNTIVSIGCCNFTSFILDEYYVLKGFGQYLQGTLPTYDTIEVITKSKVKYFNPGHSHVGYISVDNKLYLFGTNYHNECGVLNEYNGNPSESWIRYNRININSTIIDVKCGWNITIFKTINNDYYACGTNTSNELLLHNHRYQNNVLPTKISMKYIHEITKSNKPVLDLIPGYQMTYILQEY